MRLGTSKRRIFDSVLVFFRRVMIHRLQCFPEKSASLRAEEGWRSTAYRQRVARTSVAFDTNKDDAEAVRYITVIYPVKDVAAYPVFEAKFLNKGYDEKGVEVEVSVNGTVRRLASRLN